MLCIISRNLAKQKNPFYLNLFVAVALFVLSVIVTNWKELLSDHYPKREQQYINLKKLYPFYNENFVNMKSNAIAFVEPIVRKDDELFPFGLALEASGIEGVDLLKGEVGRRPLLSKSQEPQNVKMAALQAAATAKTVVIEKEISRIVLDPYLKMLRRTMGLSETLTEADVLHLKCKPLDPEDKDFSRLLVLASISFIEGDGEGAIVYLERAQKLEGLPDNIKLYLNASVEGLKHPDDFGESLGYIVMDIEKDGLFSQSGIQLSDILIGIDGNPLIEPTDISSALARTPDHPFLIKLVRDGRRIEVAIRPGKSAGVTITQLVAFGQVRL